MKDDQLVRAGARGPIENEGFVFPEVPMGLSEIEAEWLRWYVVTNDQRTATKQVTGSGRSMFAYAKILRKPAARAYMHEIRAMLYRRCLLTTDDILVELESIALDPKVKVKYRLRAFDQIRRIMVPTVNRHAHLHVEQPNGLPVSVTGQLNESGEQEGAGGRIKGLRGLSRGQVDTMRNVLLGISEVQLPDDDSVDPPIDREIVDKLTATIAGEPLPVAPVKQEREVIGRDAIEIFQTQREERAREGPAGARERLHRERLTAEFRTRLAACPLPELDTDDEPASGPPNSDGGNSSGSKN